MGIRMFHLGKPSARSKLLLLTGLLVGKCKTASRYASPHQPKRRVSDQNRSATPESSRWARVQPFRSSAAHRNLER